MHMYTYTAHNKDNAPYEVLSVVMVQCTCIQGCTTSLTHTHIAVSAHDCCSELLHIAKAMKVCPICSHSSRSLAGQSPSGIGSWLGVEEERSSIADSLSLAAAGG